MKIAVVGTGFAAQAHLDALRRVPGVEVAAVVGRTVEKAAALADKYQIPGAYDHWQRVVDDPGVDAIDNCTPNNLHAEVNLAALAAGKHILSEKPLGLTAAETAMLAAAAAESGRLAAVCFTYRHYPMIAEMREHLRGNGEVVAPVAHLVHGRYLQDWLFRDDDWSWRIDPAIGGELRAVGDIGSHWIDLVQYLTGDLITEVAADFGRLHQTRQRFSTTETFSSPSGESETVRVTTEDYANVMVRFRSGLQGQCSISQVCAGYKNDLRLLVETNRGSYEWVQEQPNSLRIGHRDGPNLELQRDAALLTPAAAAITHYPNGHPEGWPDALRNLLTDFCAAVVNWGPVDGNGRAAAAPAATVATFAEAHQVMQVCEAIGRSAHEHAWMPVGMITTELSPAVGEELPQR
jgi:predicted dehydrogenase